MPKSNPRPHTHFGKKPRKIYLDYGASTPVLPEVSTLMRKVSVEHFESASSIHEGGVRAQKVLEEARRAVAGVLHSHEDEVVFTSGATESNNLAIFGLVNYFHSRISKKKLPHIITTNIEHSSVLEIFKHLEETKKAQVSYVAVGENGVVDVKKIKKELRSNTVLVSVMYANSEIGTIAPIREIAKELRLYGKKKSQKIFFHTDATQAINYLPVNVVNLGVDLLSLSGIKIYGPRGTGALFIKRGTPLEKIFFGGDQQFNLRSGSYNLPGIAGLAKALLLSENKKEKEVKRLIKLRDSFFLRIKALNKKYRLGIIINGDEVNRLPNNVNISIPNIPSELLVIELSAKGIMASSKSACKSGDGKASHVIAAINSDIKDTDGSLRFTLGGETTKRDVEDTVRTLSQILIKYRNWYR